MDFTEALALVDVSRGDGTPKDAGAPLAGEGRRPPPGIAACPGTEPAERGCRRREVQVDEALVMRAYTWLRAPCKYATLEAASSSTRGTVAGRAVAQPLPWRAARESPEGRQQEPSWGTDTDCGLHFDRAARAEQAKQGLAVGVRWEAQGELTVGEDGRLGGRRA